MSSKKVLREYVALIVEDDGGGEAMGLMGGVDAMPYGMQLGSNSDLYNVFVAPFVDVFKVAAGKGKELSARAMAAGEVLLKAVATTLVPTLSANYKKIFEEEKSRLQRIKSEYKNVYDAVWSAFMHDDAKVLAFMYDPFSAGALLTFWGGKAGLSAALSALDVVTAGALTPLRQKLSSKGIKQQPVAYGTSDVQEGRAVMFEGVDDMKATIKQALDRPEALRMRREAQGIVQGSIKKVLQLAKETLSAPSVEAFLQKVAPEQLQALNKLPTQEKAALKGPALEALKASAKQFFVKSIEAQVEHLKKVGVPTTNAMFKDYEAALSKIKAM
jgi:hypothetical protein